MSDLTQHQRDMQDDIGEALARQGQPHPFGDDPTYSRYEMLYCDTARCRVNTFERGTQTRGPCPGCNEPGIPVPSKRSGR